MIDSYDVVARVAGALAEVWPSGMARDQAERFYGHSMRHHGDG